MDRFYKELQELITKYSKIFESDIYLIDEEKQFNREFSYFLESEEEYLYDFLGSNLEVLKKHISTRTSDFSDLKKKKYIELLKKKLLRQFNYGYNKAENNRGFLKASNPNYFLKVLNETNKSLFRFNVDKKNDHLNELIAFGIDEFDSPVKKTKKKTLDINLNYWNENCFNLFHYLADNYYQGEKRQLTNLWYYLKNHLQDDKYYFKMTKPVYKEYILNEFNEKLTNFDKSIFKFDNEIKTLEAMKRRFETHNIA